MTIYDYIANYIQSTYKYEKNQGFWARLFYLSPAERVQRLNEIFDTNKFWESTSAFTATQTQASEQQPEQKYRKQK
ncbi:hypothetical protein [Vibrio sp. CAU 1672]|uniref:hypothetical protein n=1 Tax=Vibrio sp. CAU 1672 TaxID=3032594 RepID=UPI0023DBB2CF|nr:hypothetical protein [Vibrio sp. CAU 1672]MDF2155130.1 hypothetical protein [Vibrio sp. CAU 1672]